jgi:hypothetical protein
MTYTLIAHTELTGTQASVTFSSIPATFTDLLLVGSARTSGTVGQSSLLYRLNNSQTGYSGRSLIGTGSSASSGTLGILDSSAAGGNWGRAAFVGINGGSDTTSSTFANFSFYLPNYKSSVAKSLSLDAVTENNGTTAYQEITALLWSGTDAVTSFSLAAYVASYVAGSSFTLYGITAGSSGGVVVS